MILIGSSVEKVLHVNGPASHHDGRSAACGKCKNAHASGFPWQQFSIRKSINSLMAE